MSDSFTISLPSTRSLGGPDPAADMNAVVNAIKELRQQSGIGHSVFVSPTGDDGNDGLLPAKAKATISAALAALPSSGGEVRLNPGTHVLTAGFSVDVSLQRIVGAPGAVIDATALTGGAAITVTGTVNPPYRQARRPLENFELVGSGKTNAVTGILFNTAGGNANGSSHIQPAQLNIHGFGTGVSFGSRAYCLDMLGCDIYSCGIAVNATAGSTDGGERISLTHCTIFNNDTGIRAYNAIGEVFLFNCSLDYNARQIDIQASLVNLFGCHVEGNVTNTTRWIALTGSGASLLMVGGRFVVAGTLYAGAADYLVDNTATNGGAARFLGVMMNNTRTTSGDFSTGSGHTMIEGSTSTDTAAAPLSVGATANLLADGGFENTIVVDDWFIQGDTATVTDRFTGTNISMGTSTDAHRTLNRSLKITKVGGVGTVARAALAVPIPRGGKPRLRSYYSKPGAQTGAFTLLMHFATMRTGSAIPAYTRLQEIGEATITLTTDPKDWTVFQMGEPTVRAPAWATHLLYVVNLNAMDAGSLYLDDISITSI